MKKKLLHVIKAIVLALPVSLIPTQKVLAYCATTPTCGNAYISSVDLNGTANASGAGTYTLYSSPIFTLNPLQGGTLTISGSIAFAGNYHLNAWIDFDGSGDFNGVNSELISTPVVSYPLGAFTKVLTFVVPATATIGNSILRVQLRYVGPVFGAPNPCSTGYCGEAEDYPVVIAPLPPLCSSSSNNSSNIYISRTDVNGETTFSGPSTYSTFIPNITLFPQTNYTLSVDVTNPTGSAQTVYIRGWVEVNGDNVFSANANEQIIVTPNAVTIPAFTTQSFSKVFSYVPPYATQASILRVTASLASNGVPTPCATGFTGEVEDYTVIMHTDYCTNAASSNSQYITNVTLNGVSNPSGPSLYSDFTHVLIPVLPGQTYPFSLSTFGGPTLASVYIDFNQNGYFQDPGEQINLSAIAGGFTGNIPVPALATVGNTRMRVVTLFTVGGGNALPCFLNGVSGEVEDYTIVIISPNPPTISCPSNIVVAQAPGQCFKQVIYSLPICTSNCNGGAITLTTGLPSGANFPMGTTPVTYTVTTPGGSASCTFLVTVNLDPLPVFSPAGTIQICQGNSANLNISSYASYLWSTGATTQGIAASMAGSYTVTVTDNSGCTGSVSQTVIVNPLPTPVITGTFSFCAGSSTLLDAGSGHVGYLWSNGSSSQTLSVNAAGAYTVTVTDNAGCTASVSQSVTVNPLPTPSVTGSSSFCAGSSSLLDAGSGYVNYIWSGGSTSQTLSVNAAGMYTVTVTDNAGCTGSVSQNVIVNPLPTPVINGIFSFCSGSSTLLDAGSGHVGYLWSNGSTSQTLSVNTAGAYTVTVTDNAGCTASVSQSVTVNPLPTPAITGSSSFCAGGASLLDAGSGYANYLWSDGSTSQTLSVNAAGTYTVTVTDNTGCTGSVSQSMTENPLPTPSITGNSSFCDGSSTVLDAGNAWSAYNWSTGSTLQSATVTAAGTFTVTVTDGNGCTGTATFMTTTNPTPKATVTAEATTTFCYGGSVTLSALNLANRTYQWKKNGNVISGATSSSYSANTGGNYKVTVTNTVTGCIKTSYYPVLVTVISKPNATVTPNGPTTFCAGGNVILQAVTGAGLTYEWRTAGIAIPGATSQNYTVTTAGNYRVRVTNSNGCSNLSGPTTITIPCKAGRENGLSINVYPNPVQNKLTVSVNAKETSDCNMLIMDLSGRVVLSEKVSLSAGLNALELDVKNLSRGIYLLEVKSDRDQYKTKIVVE